MAKTNPLRFSTKYQDEETDLVYYGSRYFSPSTGRWSNRDAAGEDGGVNLYEFAANEPVSEVDALGEKILSLEIKHSGEAEIPDAEYTTLGLPYQSYFNGILIGARGFKPPTRVVAFKEPTADAGGRIYKVDRPARVVLGFKFEYVVKRDCPSKDIEKDFKITQTITGFQLIGRKGPQGTWQIVRQDEWRHPPDPDGPRLIKFLADQNKIVAGDMPRDILEINDKWEYRLSVTWKVRAQDSDNAWEGTHRINLDYSAKAGSAKPFILETPKEVPK